MTDFTPIKTQEEFDAAIGERLKRERETLTKKYADYDELKSRVPDLENQLAELTKNLEATVSKSADHEKVVADLTGKISSYEMTSLKTRIALEAGLPYEMAGRLTGEDEKALRADAETFYRLINNNQPPAPIGSAEIPVGDSNDAGYKALLNSIKEN